MCLIMPLCALDPVYNVDKMLTMAKVQGILIGVVAAFVVVVTIVGPE
jgi:hypothetical protein